MSLANLTCRPPRTGDVPFSPAQVDQVRGEVCDWSIEDAAITRELQFKGFCEAMVFANEVADVAEGQGHHPDIFISYKTVRLTLTTHKIGGLSQNDFIMAARIDQLVANPPMRRGSALMGMDRIIVTDLRARCIIGVNEDERREKQDVTINLSIYADCRTPGENDRFEDAIDYRAIKKRLLGLVENSSYFLLEALAEAIANLCLATPGVMGVQVRVDKPSALRFARSVAVEIMRERGL